MTDGDEKFHDLLNRALSGCEEAASELFHYYEHYLLQAIRSRLNKKVRSKFDSVDFAQDVWASFFAAAPEQRVFKNSADLIAFLTKLAQNKVTDAMRQRLKYQKHNINRERSLDGSKAYERENLTDPEPSPSQVISTEETWQAFLATQSLAYQHILRLLREGKSPAEIAQDLGIHERTVYRAAEKIPPGLAS